MTEFNMARPFTLLREFQYKISPVFLAAELPELHRLCGRAICSLDRIDPSNVTINFSKWVPVDSEASKSKVIAWDQGVVSTLRVPFIGSTDRSIAAGNVAVTSTQPPREHAGVSICITVDRFHWILQDEAGVSVCRDAWLAGELGKATVIAKTICPHTWPMLLAACEVERGRSPERHDLVVGPVLDRHREGES